jgi:hypothetical protein
MQLSAMSTITGYSSSLRYYPEHRVAIAFQINSDIGIE